MRRLFQHACRFAMVVVLGGLLAATFVRMSPGFGIDEEDLDSRLSRESMEALRRTSQDARTQSLGAFYGHYFMQWTHGDLGLSQTLREPVAQLLAERLPVTAESVLAGLGTGWLLGISLAIGAVMSRMSVVRIGANLVATALLCIPGAVMALLVVIVQAPGRIVVGLIVFPKIFFYAHKLLQRSASLPHVITARAKGIGSFRLFACHIFPIALPQLCALVGVSVCLAFAASIPAEVLCDLPGVGQLAWKAAMGRDLPLLVDLTILVTLITLVANTMGDLAARGSKRGDA